MGTPQNRAAFEAPDPLRQPAFTGGCERLRWTRLLVTSALIAHLRPGPYRTLFILDEFRASIGYLPIVNDFWSLVRGYGVQFMPVCQSITQLQHLFKEEWPNYPGQAGIVATIGPPGDDVTAGWMSKLGGNKTIVVEGWNEGQSANPQGSGTSEGETRSQAPRAVMLPQEIRSMLPGTGIIWLSGEGERLFPYYAPEYRWRPEIFPYLIDYNPYQGREWWQAAQAPAARFLLRLSKYLVDTGALNVIVRAYPKFMDHLERVILALQRQHHKAKLDKLRVAEKSTRRKILENTAALAVLAFAVFAFYQNERGNGFRELKAARPWVAENIPALLPYLPADTALPPELRGLGRAYQPRRRH
jgi:hypothetical protein